MRFGISTHLFHDQRLERSHLAGIAGAGFDTIELFATRSHFDYRDPAAVGALSRWLTETGIRLNSVHAPIALRIDREQQGQTLTTASADAAARLAAVQEAEAALGIAREIPFDLLVVHLGKPASGAAGSDNSRTAAVRSAEEICALAAPLGVRVAFEVIPNEISTPTALATLLERDLEAPHAGICLDFGHAHLMGDVADAVEISAEHLIATHIHDNRGREDQHLAPYLGTIDWDIALMSLQKIGFEGTYLFEVANTGSSDAVLADARRARERFERTLAHP